MILVLLGTLCINEAEVGRLVGDQRSVAIDVVTNDLERSALVGHVIDHEASRLEASRVHRHRRGVDDREVLGTLGQIDRVLSPVHVVRSLLAIDLREVVGSLVRRRVGDIEVLGAIVGVVTLRSLDVERDGLSLARELRRDEPVVVAVGSATEVTEAQQRLVACAATEEHLELCGQVLAHTVGRTVAVEDRVSIRSTVAREGNATEDVRALAVSIEECPGVDVVREELCVGVEALRDRQFVHGGSRPSQLDTVVGLGGLEVVDARIGSGHHLDGALLRDVVLLVLVVGPLSLAPNLEVLAVERHGVREHIVLGVARSDRATLGRHRLAVARVELHAEALGVLQTYVADVDGHVGVLTTLYVERSRDRRHDIVVDSVVDVDIIDHDVLAVRDSVDNHAAIAVLLLEVLVRAIHIGGSPTRHTLQGAVVNLGSQLLLLTVDIEIDLELALAARISIVLEGKASVRSLAHSHLRTEDRSLVATLGRGEHQRTLVIVGRLAGNLEVVLRVVVAGRPGTVFPFAVGP